MAKRTSRTRKVLYFIAFLTIAGGLAFAFGPRPVADTSIDFSETTLPDDLDRYLEQSEAGFEDIRPGSERQIVWAYPASRARTPLALVYIHGFSAGPGETRPLPDLVASEVGRKTFLLRPACAVTGTQRRCHGLSDREAWSVPCALGTERDLSWKREHAHAGLGKITRSFHHQRTSTLGQPRVLAVLGRRLSRAERGIVERGLVSESPSNRMAPTAAARSLLTNAKWAEENWLLDRPASAGPFEPPSNRRCTLNRCGATGVQVLAPCLCRWPPW